jgi:hypothetical protein
MSKNKLQGKEGDKYVVMSDDDLAHLKIMFNAAQPRFTSHTEAMSVALEACYLTDVHVNLLNPKSYATHVAPMAEFSHYIEYDTYNARTLASYDVKLRFGTHPDGTCTVDLVRPNERVPQ